MGSGNTSNGADRQAPEQAATPPDRAVVDAAQDPAVVDAALDPAVVDAALDPAVVDAALDPAVVDAALDPAVVDAALDPAVVDAASDPADADPTPDDEADPDAAPVDQPETNPAPAAAEPLGPVAARRDPLWARVLVVLGTVLVVLAGAVLGAKGLFAKRYEVVVTQETLIAPEARPSAEPRSDLRGPLNFLLIGSDARDDNPEDGERSDTVIVAHVSANLDRVTLISIPRDLRVRIPPFGPTGFRGSTEKINGAFQYGGGRAGGVQLLSATLTQLLGIRFDGAAVVDFGGFKKAVELLGGVHMCVDVRTESVHMGFDKNGKYAPPYLGPEQTRRNPNSTPVVYEPGCRDFVPWQALDFIRQRKTLPDGDYGRQRHQQQFLKALLNKAMERGVASNPIEADRFIRAIGGSLTVDTNGIGIDDLVFGLRNVESGQLTGITVPSEPVDSNGYSYIVALREAESLYAALRDDTLEQWIAANPTWVNSV